MNKLTQILTIAGWLLTSQLVSEAAPTAADVRRETKIESGLAIVIGGNAELPVGLADGGRMQLHWLVADAAQVEKARAVIQERGFGGRVVVGVLPADGHLPHPDRFVNLVVSELDRPDTAEIQRVLAVQGAAYLQRQGQWQTVIKSKDDKIDGWYQHWYDATGNCVSRDRVAGYPEAVQWQHGPAMEDVCGGGKIVRIADGYWVVVDAATSDLVCRDAGNGMLRWRMPGYFSDSDDMALHGGRIYCYYDANSKVVINLKQPPRNLPLVAIDLATGKVLQTYDQAKRTGLEKAVEVPEGGAMKRVAPVPWFVVNDQVIVQSYGPDLIVLDRQTGQRRWQQTLAGATWFSPTVAGDLVLAAEAVTPGQTERYNRADEVRAVTAYNLADGKLRWRNESVHPLREMTSKLGALKARASFKPLAVAEGLVVIHTASYQARTGHTITVLDAATGRELWKREYQPGELYDNASQRVVVRAGEVILLDGMGVHRFEARTGKPIGGVLTAGTRAARGNGACTSSRATLDCLIANAWLYIGTNGQPRANFGARSACGQGLVPANGLVYVLPTACDCGDYTRGYQALAPKVPGQPIADAQRLTTGVAATPQAILPGGWETYLGNPERQSVGTAVAAGELKEKWRTRVGKLRLDDVDADRRNSERYLGALSAPVMAGGLVVVAAPETHEVLAFDATTGKPSWRFNTGGKVDSPPTLIPARGLAIFGCDDGAVYAVRLTDGKLVWRFLAAPTDGIAMLHGHLASAFPLPGSALVLGDTVIAVAGLHSDIGGLHCWALDVATGKPRAQRAIQTGQRAVITTGLAIADSDGKGFWIGRQLHLSTDLKDLTGGSPALAIDRNGDRIRFRTDRGRGGSTHNWGGAMRTGAQSAHRIATDGVQSYLLMDPSSPGSLTPVLRCGQIGKGPQDLVWKALSKELGLKDSYSALIKAGDRLYAGGGKRDGTAGFVQILSTTDGKLLSELALPARVTECGLATAQGQLIVCCEDGSVVAFGK